MLVDAQELDDGAEIASQICVVGAGPAGVTIAQELAGTSWHVCLVESGGLVPDASAQELGRLGRQGDFFPPESARHRQFGGVANRWDVRITTAGGGCRYVPLDPIDFETRDWVPHSGWPLSHADLEPFYTRALRICGVGDGSYRLDDWLSPAMPALPLDHSRVTTSIEHFGTADVFTHQARAVLERAANVTVLLHATVTALDEARSSTTIARVRVACPSGRRHSITASHFVLAAGGIENPRLLLLSNRTRPAGLGNHHDLVGRFFMDHHNVEAGFLVPARRRLLETTALYDLRPVRGKPVMGKLRIATDLMRSARLLNSAARLEPGRAPHLLHAPRSLRRFITAAAALRRLAPRSPRGLYGWSELRAKRWRFDGFHVELQIEHAPDPANRVVLADERDHLELPRAAIHWRWATLDLESLHRVQRILAEACARAGVGRLELPPPDAPPTVSALGGIHHHMGTTRMHADERRGVVDADGRVHGVPNLFVTGSSVFPTGGYANPTLTLVALAVRLADHLKVLMTPRS